MSEDYRSTSAPGGDQSASWEVTSERDKPAVRIRLDHPGVAAVSHRFETTEALAGFVASLQSAGVAAFGDAPSEQADPDA